jgi:hypothetical protein
VCVKFNDPDGWAERGFQDTAIGVERLWRVERCADFIDGGAKALKIKYEDIEVGLDFEPEAGLADNGDLEGGSGDIATLFEKPTNSLGPLRASLIIKGMISSPKHGDTAFTVPLFDEFYEENHAQN